MPTQTPLPDAIRKVLDTKDGKKREWAFKGFTEPLGEEKNRNSQRSGKITRLSLDFKLESAV